MSQSAFDSLLQKYLAGQCSPAEEKIILEWYEKLIVDSDLHLSEDQRSEIEARLWAQIQAATTETQSLNAPPLNTQPMDAPPVFGRHMEPPPVEIRYARGLEKAKLVRFRHRIAWVAAAILLVAVGAAALYYRPAHTSENEQRLAWVPEPDFYTQEVNKDTKEPSRLILEDSTVILLQPGATVYYPRKFTGDTREVYLSGSAFFLVRHNPQKHFIVHAGGRLTTEVLGTSFHIFQGKDTDKIEVQVVTGKVCVYPQQKHTEDKPTDPTERIILTPNEKVVFNTSTHEFVTGLVDKPQPVPPTDMPVNEAAVADNRFIFEDEPLNKVLEVMSKAYGLTITTESDKLSRLHFTGNISKYDLYKQLDIICQSTKTTYEVNGEKIVLKRKAQQTGESH